MLEMQGFTAVSDERLRLIRPWLRVAPAITATWMLLGTLVQSSLILWFLVPFALLGAILPTHPFDVFYNYCARYILGQPVLPENPAQRRVCCALAGAWAIATAVLIQLGHPTAATVVGLIATAGCALPALTDFCVPSLVMSLLGSARQPACTPNLSVELRPEPRGRWWDAERPIAQVPVTYTVYLTSDGRRRVES
jgi:hypothetical protein